MSRAMDRAAEVAAELDAVEGIRATDDPAAVSASLPCVLVAPPRLVYGTLDGQPSEAVWRLLVLGPGLATRSAIQAVLDLLELVAVQVPLESADPGTYQLGQELVACYVATWTDDPTTWPPPA